MPFLDHKIFGTEQERYMEPFLGGGAFFFYFQFVPAVLSDINEDLINTYIQVKNHPDELIARLKTLEIDIYTYSRLRSSRPICPIERAVRFLYLNRTAFAGIYRLNKKGEFNVPFGKAARGTAALWDSDLLMSASLALQGTTIFASDFQAVIDNAGEGDLIYCDPTYTMTHNNNGFRKYNEICFSWSDQERLAKCCSEAAERGATVIVSNAYHLDVRQLYDGFESFVVQRKSVVCPDPTKRVTTNEYVFIKLN